MTTDPAVREAFLAGLRDLADFLAAHPGVAVPAYGEDILLFPSGDDDRENLQAIAQFAEAAGVAVVSEWSTCGECRAPLRFGPVGYTALAHSKACMAEFDERRSYCGNVQTGEAA